MEMLQFHDGLAVELHVFQAANEIVGVELDERLLEKPVQLAHVDRLHGKGAHGTLGDQVAVDFDHELVAIDELERDAVLAAVVDHDRVVHQDLQSWPL